jgi:hypothetical protein
MDDGKLRQILFQLQEQNKDLLTMVMNLQVSNNQLKQKLNIDFQEVYGEIYEPKDIKKIKEYLDSKKFIMEEFNDMTDKESNKTIVKFQEDFECMEENLEKIVR